MAFLKYVNLWKHTSRHKKLSEELAFVTSLQEFSKQQGFDDYEPSVFDVKYLGCTFMKDSRSEDETAAAVKTVIQQAKPIYKKLRKVSLYVSPKGIEIVDTLSGETIFQISIYKISYCSADAIHTNVFSFISTTGDIDTDSCPSGSESDGSSSSRDSEGQLVLHAFLCTKRKIAQNVTLTAAKCFETAFKIWHDDFQRKRTARSSKQTTKSGQQQDEKKENAAENTVRNMLIDFNADLTNELCTKDPKQYFQNAWVSFDDQNQNATNNATPKTTVNDHQDIWGTDRILS